MAITHAPVVPTEFDTLAAANRHAVYGLVARWLVHDLRNPTQALTLITELMGDEPETAGAAETVREATARLGQSLQLLDRLLRLPRPRTEPVPVSLQDSLDFVAALHRSHRSGTQLDLESAAGSSLPPIGAAEHEVEQILLNLVLNAQEALSERPGGRLVIRADLVDGSVRVSVADNGPGVQPERRACLFEPAPALRAGRLRGLGLTVSRGLARRAGGDLVYFGGDGPGARFDLLLPAWRRG
ncbi:MAG TPA: HAMP domain-containing sensor histidine kinase [Gemmatimonadales bacterium]|nr:HAMP domain-containing sensor histidine kinase [Gemmatimonadales bacterium]